MANRITPEQIEQINEVYFQTKNKALTARTVGVSAASVSKYIVADYVPKSQRIVKETNFTCAGVDNFIEQIKTGDVIEMFCKGFELTEDEWAGLKELQKEVF